LDPENVRFELGNTTLPTTQWSGGSMAAGRVSSVYLAAQEIWQKLTKLAVADKKSPLYGAAHADVMMQGRLQLKADLTKGETFDEVMKRANMSAIEGSALSRYRAGYKAPGATAKADMNKKQEAFEHSMHAFGVHFCEVHVGPELGTVCVRC
jgi:xanthine dehydrogenase YagR molybdenum-binding subunit